jgi:hypothetical protein
VSPKDRMDLPHSPSWGQLDWLARDPDFAWVSWSVSADAIDHARAKLGPAGASAPLVLRVTAQRRRAGSHPRPETLDVPIERWSGQRLVPLGAHGQPHLCALGLKAHGWFVAILRADPLTPPKHAAPQDDPDAPA